ncbi:hypothetical protein HCN44_009849 [Aphidius gifuensis]|uniref:FLYWCH-type domain-containing protein n=1 Tax=Aphidius gifuensis TaxID=684658 RepID=A0A835CUF1_APHGI|nr:hypothetical protein HCN44_009849 [Aphidius gifuensis]
MENSELILLGETKLISNGFIYLRSRKPTTAKTYWDCRKLRGKECSARAITIFDPVQMKTIFLKEPEHDHPGNHEECYAEIKTYKLKRKAEEHPEQPPAQILRTELAGLSEGVLSQLPERESLKKCMRRARRRYLPPNPTTLTELTDLPDKYQKTLSGETFLIYDSLHDDIDEDEAEDEHEDDDKKNRVLN